MRALLAAALVAAVALSPSALANEKTSIAIVVDRESTRTDISLQELRAIYLGQQREWQDGSRIVVLQPEEGSPEREAFNAAVLGMDEGEVQRYWVDQRMRGNGSAPRTAPTAGTLVKLAGRVKGVIGYVPLRAVDASVKVLRVEGVAPGKPGYAIEGR